MKYNKVSTMELMNGPEKIVEKEYYDHNFMIHREVIIDDEYIQNEEKYFRIGPFVIKKLVLIDETKYELYFFGTRKKKSLDNYVFRFANKNDYSIQWFMKDKLVKQIHHIQEYIDILLIKYDNEMYPRSFTSISKKNGKVVETIIGSLSSIYPRKIAFKGIKKEDPNFHLSGIYNCLYDYIEEKIEVSSNYGEKSTITCNEHGDGIKFTYDKYNLNKVYEQEYYHHQSSSAEVNWEYF